MPPLYLSSNYCFAGFDQKRQLRLQPLGQSDPGRAGRDPGQAGRRRGRRGGLHRHGGGGSGFFSLEPGDLLIAPHDCYGGTHRLLCARARKGHFEVAFVDQGDPEALERALALKPKLVLIETPSNPLMRVVDVADICRRAHAAGAKVVADNTFLSPALQQPIELGADFVVHSTTKYINGHSDVVGGGGDRGRSGGPRGRCAGGPTAPA